MDIRTLISNEGSRYVRSYLAVPQEGHMDMPSHEVSLIAVVLSYDMWTQGSVHNTHWRFFKYGVECTWDDLSDEQRWEVRAGVAWDGQVKDYWTELKYRDKRYCILEALL